MASREASQAPLEFGGPLGKWEGSGRWLNRCYLTGVG